MILRLRWKKVQDKDNCWQLLPTHTSKGPMLATVSKITSLTNPSVEIRWAGNSELPVSDRPGKLYVGQEFVSLWDTDCENKKKEQVLDDLEKNVSDYIEALFPDDRFLVLIDREEIT